MSLVKREVEIEEGTHGNFEFTLRLLYKGINCVGGVVYLREKNRRIEDVELLIAPESRSIDFEPLKLAAAKCNYEVEGLENLQKEIFRKYSLVNLLRTLGSDSPFPKLLEERPEVAPALYLPQLKKELSSILEEYPELKLPKYYSKLTEKIRGAIEEYLKA